ncbi:MAG: hypothetical protein HQK54_01405, partial [Oligoflexales bacterium]|nr:hypothetical protein [Oligoflexales bacterium]
SDYAYERFEVQKFLSLFFAYPETLEKVTDVKDGMPGFFVHNFQYFGIISALLMILGLIRSKNPFWATIVGTIVAYVVFSIPGRSPLFETALRIHYPMTRHFLFTLLHLTPILAILSGFGMDVVLEMGSIQKNRFSFPFLSWLKSNAVKIMVTLIIPVLCIVYVAIKMLEDSSYASAQQGFLYSIILMAASLLVLYRVLSENNIRTKFNLLFTLAVIDLSLFNHIALLRIVNTGRTNHENVFEQAVTYDQTIPDMDELDTFRPFSPLPPDAYFRWESPRFYFPKLYKYAIIGNKSYYDLSLSSSNAAINQVSGYTLPRIFFTDKAILDISEENAKQYFSKVKNDVNGPLPVFLHSNTIEGAEALISKPLIKDFPVTDIPRAIEYINFYKISSTMFKTNVISQNGDISNLIFQGKNKNNKLIPSNESDKQIWFQVDFGHDHEEVVNVIKASSLNTSIDFWGVTELQCSNDSNFWKHCGFLNNQDATLENQGVGVWYTLNQTPYRYYRILIREKNFIRLQNLASLQFGKKYREIVGGKLGSFNKIISLASFQGYKFSDDGKYWLMRFQLPRDVGVNLTTEPSQLFAFKYNIRREGVHSALLKPTWGDDWYKENLFQISYKGDGIITVNIPVDTGADYLSSTINMSVLFPHNDFSVLDYGADSLVIKTNRTDSGWLYYADSWDPYWIAKIDGRQATLLKANLQFKAVFVPSGEHMVTFSHRPNIFNFTIIASYILQFGCLGLFFILRKRCEKETS